MQLHVYDCSLLFSSLNYSIAKNKNKSYTQKYYQGTDFLTLARWVLVVILVTGEYTFGLCVCHSQSLWIKV